MVDLGGILKVFIFSSSFPPFPLTQAIFDCFMHCFASLILVCSPFPFSSVITGPEPRHCTISLLKLEETNQKANVCNHQVVFSYPLLFVNYKNFYTSTPFYPQLLSKTNLAMKRRKADRHPFCDSSSTVVNPLVLLDEMQSC